MPFSGETIQAAWQRSGGRCECERVGHGHEGRCGRELVWDLQGADSDGGWRPRRKATWGNDALANCEIRCASCQRPEFATVY